MQSGLAVDGPQALQGQLDAQAEAQGEAVHQVGIPDVHEGVPETVKLLVGQALLGRQDGGFRRSDCFRFRVGLLGSFQKEKRVSISWLIKSLLRTLN